MGGFAALLSAGPANDVLRFSGACYVIHQTLFVKKALHDRIGLYRHKEFFNCCDYEFILRMGDPYKHPIHEQIRSCMKAWPTLFIGYGLRDYNLRLLFRTLRWNLDPADYPISFSIDPFPDDLVVTVWQRYRPPMVSFIKEDLWRFVPVLYKAVIGKDFV